MCAQHPCDFARLTEVESVKGLIGHEHGLRCDKANRKKNPLALTF